MAPASFVDLLYPSNGVQGAHFSLEVGNPHPAAFRGGSTKKGSHYPGADHATWLAAQAHMVACQMAEEARVIATIQAAFNAHLVPVAKLNPGRRKAGVKPSHVT